MLASCPDPQTHTATSGHVYSYYHLPPHDASKPTILFLHGYPDMGLGWSRQIGFFVGDHGYGAILPDLLGAGRTDKPQDVESYRAQSMAAEAMEIVDKCVGKEGKVIVMGHDWYEIL